MITRILKPNEQYLAKRIHAVCFEFGVNFEEEKQKALALTQDEILKAQTPQDGDKYPKNRLWGSFEDDNKTLMGCIGVNTYNIKFDGKECLMAGIGGVATLPPYRRSGAIRECLKSSFKQLRDEGFAFSYLYPFSQAYYRKFGFEGASPAYEWEIPLSALNSEYQGGKIEQLFKGDDLSPLLEIYNEVFKDYNLSVIRKEFDLSLNEENLLEQLRYIYLWRDDTGRPRGFFISKKDGRALNCTTVFGLKNAFLAVDAQAYEALFNFAKTAFSADYDSIRVNLPCSIPVSYFVSDTNRASCKLSNFGMVRVISVPFALENCKCKESGSINIEINDNILSENTGVWKLEFSNGMANKVSITDESPDITMPISTFSALISGARKAEDLPMMKEVKVHNQNAPFEKVFYNKLNYVMDLF